MTDPIRQAIIDARERRKVTLAQLAEAADMRVPHLSAALNGKRGIPYEALVRICDHLRLRLVQQRGKK